MCTTVQGQPPGERQEMTSLCQKLDQGRIRAEQLVRAAQFKGVAKSPAGTDRIVVAVFGKAQPRQQQARRGVLIGDRVVFVLGPDIGGAQSAGAEAAVAGQFQGQYAAVVGRGLFLLQVQLQGCGGSDIPRTGDDVAGYQPLEPLGDEQVGIQFMPQAEHVQVAVPNREAGTRIRTVADAWTQAPARSGC